jgi:hypothetical protein
MSALKAWNDKHGGKYRIPKKGTAEYNEVRALMGGSDKVIMPRKEYEKEHKELVEVLEKGSKKERMKEARKQKTEVKHARHGEIMDLLREVLDQVKKD